VRKLWEEKGWEDYLYWQKQDKKTLKKINDLIKDIERNGNEGIGKPEPLKANLSRAGGVVILTKKIGLFTEFLMGILKYYNAVNIMKIKNGLSCTMF
jgi:hypothetical protein